MCDGRGRSVVICRGRAWLGNALSGLDKAVAGETVSLCPKLLAVHFKCSFFIAAVIRGGLLVVVLVIGVMVMILLGLCADELGVRLRRC